MAEETKKARMAKKSKIEKMARLSINGGPKAHNPLPPEPPISLNPLPSVASLYSKARSTQRQPWKPSTKLSFPH